MKRPILCKGDRVRLNDGVIGDVTDVWGVARCHAIIQTNTGCMMIMADRDVESIVKRSSAKK